MWLASEKSFDERRLARDMWGTTDGLSGAVTRCIIDSMAAKNGAGTVQRDTLLDCLPVQQINET
jgi:hypothetical protein